MLDGPISHASAWTAETAIAGDGVVSLDETCRDELARTAAHLDANPLPLELLRPDEVEMPACRGLMAGVLETLTAGAGFALIDGMHIDGLAPETVRKLYWLLISTLGPPVAQKWDGTMVYEVTDTGLTERAGNGVRSSKTSQGQYYHTDNSFNLPPDFVALMCLRPAKSGGRSGIVSFQTAYNRLLDEAPELIGRYYRPFWFDRQHEHAPGDERLSRSPVFEDADGAVHVRFSRRLIEYGYELSGEPMDAETRAAVTKLCEIMERPELNRSFDFRPGQIQVLNNRRLGHRRTAFEDWPEPDRRRHLLRLWVRREGGRNYLG